MLKNENQIILTMLAKMKQTILPDFGIFNPISILSVRLSVTKDLDKGR